MPEGVSHGWPSASDKRRRQSIRSSSGWGLWPPVDGRGQGEVEVTHHTDVSEVTAEGAQDTGAESSPGGVAGAGPVRVHQGEVVARPLDVQGLQAPRPMRAVIGHTGRHASPQQYGSAIVLMHAVFVGRPKAGVSGSVGGCGRHVEPQFQVRAREGAPSRRGALRPRFLQADNVQARRMPRMHQTRDLGQRGQATHIVRGNPQSLLRRRAGRVRSISPRPPHS